jgi:hypothetical protein
MPTIKNLYVIIARDISVDSTDQMNSIMKIIDKFTFGYQPEKLAEQGITLGEKTIVFPAKYSVATSWHFGDVLKQDTPLVFRIEVLDPKNKSFDGPSHEYIAPTGVDKVNINFNMEGMPVTVPGKYRLVARAQSKTGEEIAKSEYPFSVELTEAGSGTSLAPKKP